jgi:hypothetical protein
MSRESLTLIIPDWLARELDSVEEGFLVDLLKRGAPCLRTHRLLSWNRR